MKQIIAIIRPNAVERVEHALHELDHFPGFTMLRVKGESRGRGLGHAYTPNEWDLEEHDNTMLFVICADDLAPSIVDKIRNAAHTGRPGDGVIAISEISDVVRIRTDDHGAAAV
jgi:nitrogen regulatory protein P-II 1